MILFNGQDLEHIIGLKTKTLEDTYRLDRLLVYNSVLSALSRKQVLQLETFTEVRVCIARGVRVCSCVLVCACERRVRRVRGVRGLGRAGKGVRCTGLPGRVAATAAATAAAEVVFGVDVGASTLLKPPSSYVFISADNHTETPTNVTPRNGHQVSKCPLSVR